MPAAFEEGPLEAPVAPTNEDFCLFCETMTFPIEGPLERVLSVVTNVSVAKIADIVDYFWLEQLPLNRLEYFLHRFLLTANRANL